MEGKTGSEAWTSIDYGELAVATALGAAGGVLGEAGKLYKLKNLKHAKNIAKSAKKIGKIKKGSQWITKGVGKNRKVISKATALRQETARLGRNIDAFKVPVAFEATKAAVKQVEKKATSTPDQKE